MKDDILEARLVFLDEQLERAENALRWLEGSQILQNLGYDMQKIAAPLETTIVKEARLQRKSIERAQAELNLAAADASGEPHLAAAWQMYNQSLEKSQELLGQWLELIGGIALRDKQFDCNVCDLADELIRTCCDDTIGPTIKAPDLFVTVPAQQDAVSKTWFRMIRLRFPHWTVWHLPLTAAEFGYVLFDEWDDLSEFLDEQVKLWGRTGNKQKPAPKTGSKRRNIRSHMRKLIADGFAALTMGPAYAYSAFYLNFSAGHAETEDSPSDAARAFVVLRMIDLMNQHESEKPYREHIERLDEKWKASCKFAEGQERQTELEEGKLNSLCRAVWNFLNDQFRFTGRYPYLNGDQGWNTAQRIRRYLENPQQYPMPFTSSTRLRDVLNAGWLRRIEIPAGTEHDFQVKQLAKAIMHLCRHIVDQRRGIPARAEQPQQGSIQIPTLGGVEVKTAGGR
ncbi:MAG: hypothetical protein HUU41_11105 [Bryobacteraceae bacterium]|nr:hypothetical protein [Bryobacterales bacterium]MEB2361976.1 hypothetical protein [Bryobacterales bacterium]NUN01652.1 hypothetical protein [Bryobacteraceae bacterium]